MAAAVVSIGTCGSTALADASVICSSNRSISKFQLARDFDKHVRLALRGFAISDASF